MSLIFIDVTADGAPELCGGNAPVVAAMVQTNISDSIVAD